LVLILLLYQLFQVPYIFACQYNVRETGFVDLGNTPYLFTGYVDDQASDDMKVGFNQIAIEMLSESNIEFEMINIDRHKNHTALKYLDQWQINEFPSAVLVSPDSQSIPVTIYHPGQKFGPSLQSAIDEIVSSPYRDRIIEAAVKNYAVVFLIAGKNEEENKKANETAMAAINHVKKKMDMLPKPIRYPPVLIEMDYASIREEKILLWSLGIDINDMAGPYVAVIYGRGRWIGPLFMGTEINKNYLSEILLVVGADCECGLDQEWLQGTMLPARWDKERQARITESLGFDPENPIIKSEISRIIRMGSLYQGLAADSQISRVQSDVQPIDTLNTGHTLAETGIKDSLSQKVDKEPLFKKSFYITILSLLVIFVVGMVIVMRRARK